MNTFGTRSLSMAALVLAGVFASAQTFTLTDAGATVDVDSTSATIDNFVVGGIDQVFQQTYFLRNGDGGTAVGLDTFTLVSSSQPISNFLELVYTNGTFNVQIRYLLSGGQNEADLTEAVTVRNISGQSASLRFFQYNDWDMAGTADDDTVMRTNSSTMEQSDGVVTAATAVHGGTPIPTFTGMSEFDVILNDITGTAGYNLDTSQGDGIGDSLTGDATYAFQWNRELAANATFSMSTDKIAAVPEPGSMIALGLGISALLARRRKKTA